MKKNLSILFFLFMFVGLLNSPAFSQARRMVGVFKFDNEGSPEQDWVARGIEEILYEKLKQVNSLTVYERETLHRISAKLDVHSSKEITPRKAFQIGKETGIEVIFMGNYRVNNGRLSVGFRLVSTYTGEDLITQGFSDKLENIFDVFDRIVELSLATIRVSLSGTEKQYLAKKPTDSILAFEYYCKAYIAIAHGSTMDEIAGYFQRAIQKDPNFWEAHYNLGVIYYNFDLYNKALRQFNTVIDKEADFYKPYYGKAVIYYLKRDYLHSLNEFKTVLRLYPEHDRSYYFMGIIYSRLDSLEKGSKYLDKSIELNPNYAPAYYQQSLVEIKRGWYKKAIISARKALKLNPDYYQANRALGEAYYALNLFDESIIEFNKVIKLRPTYATAYFDLGNAIYKKGAVEEIVDAYWSLIENRYTVQNSQSNQAANKNPYSGLADLREKSRSTRTEVTMRKMISAYRKAIKYDKSFFEAAYNLALTYENFGKIDSAEYYYQKTISIKPDLVQAHMRLGRIYEKQRNYDLALQQFKEIVKYEPEYFASSPQLGESYRNINIIETVLQDYQHRLSVNPHDKEALKVVGSIYLSIGRLGQAEEYYQQLVVLNPNDKSARSTLKQIRNKMNKF